MAHFRPQSPMPRWIRNLAFLLAGLIAAFGALHLLVRNADPLLKAKFDLNAESAVPSWFASVLLLAVGACGFRLLRFELGRDERPCVRKIFWLAFGTAFVFLSLDESAMIHETMGLLSEDGGRLLYGAGGAAFFAACFWVLRRYENEAARARRFILAGFLLYGAAALGLDAWDDHLIFLRIPNSFYVALFEEVFEMGGAVLILTGCLLMLEPKETGPRPAPAKPADRRCLLRLAGAAVLAVAAVAAAAVLYFRSPEHISRFSLDRRLAAAAAAGQTEREYRLTLVLFRRFLAGRADRDTLFRHGLRTANLEKKLGRREQSLARIESLARSVAGDRDKEAQHALFKARLALDGDDPAAAEEILKRVEPGLCLPGTRFEVEMTRAALESKAGRRSEARARYERLCETYWAFPQSRSQAAWELAALLHQEGDLPGAHEALGRMTSGPPSLELYLQVERSYVRLLVLRREYEKAARTLGEIARCEGLPPSEMKDIRAERISLQRKIRNVASRRGPER